jgi:hypothetical protein
MDFWNGLLEMRRIYERVGLLGDVPGQKPEREVEKPDRDIFDKQSPVSLTYRDFVRETSEPEKQIMPAKASS